MTSAGPPVAELRERVRRLMPRARADLERLVAYRSVADPSVEPASECAAAADAVAELFAEVGVGDVRLVDAPDGSRSVFGRIAAPAGAPTVLLYSHYDVQPADPQEWSSPPYTLTERAGRWYGRGAADCKGNLVMHLTALRALDGEPAVGVRMVCEGSEEQPTDGLQRLLAADPESFRADVVVIADTGNVALGVPTLTTSLRGTASVVVSVSTLGTSVHSGMFGGAAPDALAALIAMLATLRDEQGETTVAGLDHSGRWEGAAYDVERFRADATVLEGVSLTGSDSVADALWARPSLSVLGIDCPSVAAATAAVPATARAVLSLRIPPGTDSREAQEALVSHLLGVAPWGARVEVTRLPFGQPFRARASGTAYAAFRAAMESAFGAPLVTTGQGGSIPFCSALSAAFPEAEILLAGVEEPACRIHAPDESVHPAEIERMALAEALFLSRPFPR